MHNNLEEIVKCKFVVNSNGVCTRSGIRLKGKIGYCVYVHKWWLSLHVLSI